jgi:hypothetical protein
MQWVTVPITDVIPCVRYRVPLVLYSRLSLLGSLSPFRVPSRGDLGLGLGSNRTEQSNERGELGYGHFVTADYINLATC